MNLINLLRKKQKPHMYESKGGNIRIHKRDIPMNKEWYNSVYSYNKNLIRFLPAVYNFTFVLLKRYFNMTSHWMEKNLKIPKYKNVSRLSGRKLWVSNPEIKHFDDKLNITIYIYNRTYNFYKKKLEMFEFIWGPTINTEKKSKSYMRKKRKLSSVAKRYLDTYTQLLYKSKQYSYKSKQYLDYYKKYLNVYKKYLYYLKKSNITKYSALRLLKKEFPIYIGTNKSVYSKSKSYYIKVIKWLKLSKYKHLMQYKSKIVNLFEKNKQIQLVKFLKLLKIQHYNYLINQFSKELMYLKFKQKMTFNEFKYNEFYLSNFTKFIESIYKKKIEWNIVTLKHYYLNTNILLQIIATKVKNPKFRGKSSLALRYAMNKVTVPILSKKELAGEAKPYIGVQNVKLNQFSFEKDHLNKFLVVNANSKIWSSNNIDQFTLTNLENKIVAGVFIKIAGRLTKRYRADKAVQKWKFKGTLQNVYSAHRNLSSSLSRGHDNINIDKYKVNSKVRIGAFGLTGWISSY